jgi:hypothetical protein
MGRNKDVTSLYWTMTISLFKQRSVFTLEAKSSQSCTLCKDQSSHAVYVCHVIATYWAIASVWYRCYLFICRLICLTMLTYSLENIGYFEQNVHAASYKDLKRCLRKVGGRGGGRGEGGGALIIRRNVPGHVLFCIVNKAFPQRTHVTGTCAVAR